MSGPTHLNRINHIGRGLYYGDWKGPAICTTENWKGPAIGGFSILEIWNSDAPVNLQRGNGKCNQPLTALPPSAKVW